MKDSPSERPVLAIVTPSFEQGVYLEKAIESVLGQPCRGIEYAVIDGGSKDGSVEIIQRHSERLAFWVSERDGGQYQAVARGFAQTSGEVLGWLNSDDQYVQGALSIVGEIFAQFPQIDWLTTLCPLWWDRHGRMIRCEKAGGFSRGSFRRGEHLPGSAGFHLGCIQQESTFWRRSLWEKAGGFDPAFPLAGDFALWSRFFAHAQLYAVAAPLGGFRVHEDQKTRSRFAEYEAEAVKALRQHGGTLASRRSGQLREMARRLPSKLWPALTAAGWMHRCSVVEWDREKNGWSIEDRYI